MEPVRAPGRRAMEPATVRLAADKAGCTQTTGENSSPRLSRPAARDPRASTIRAANPEPKPGKNTSRKANKKVQTLRDRAPPGDRPYPGTEFAPYTASKYMRTPLHR